MRKASTAKGADKSSKTPRSRQIPPSRERELWARAAGRCQFAGCNRLVYKSSVTQESVNVSEKAHIYSFSEDGPRGWADDPDWPHEINSIENLMLVCHECHKTIDVDKKGERYSVDVLVRWKQQHEHRVQVVTGIDQSKASHVVFYGASIGNESSVIRGRNARQALFPERYPASEAPVDIAMKWETRDASADYWPGEAANLSKAFARQVRPLIDAGDPSHFSVFALAPMPLLVQLGALFTDKVVADVYQLHREPPTWGWLEGPTPLGLRLVRPPSTQGPPALIISISAKVAQERITSVVGADTSIWELTVDNPNNDVLRSRDQLEDFRRVARSVIAEIGDAHGRATQIKVFPAMPVACAVELGRVRMPKADGPFVMFDQTARGRFEEVLTIGA